MSFRYFAYGSNLWLPQLRSRCPSARVIGTAVLVDWELICDKPSTDGSLKLNIRPHPGFEVNGVVYEIDDPERSSLDEAEPGYSAVHVELERGWTLTYTYEGDPGEGDVYEWYAAVVTKGMRSHGLVGYPFPEATVSDPLAPGVRPASTEDAALIHSILSAGLSAETARYYVHPGDFDWWVYHDDPRYPDHDSTWVQDDTGFVLIDSRDPTEINAFTRPDVDRMPLIRWAQRRLNGRGEVGWISDDDELTTSLADDGYQKVFTYRCYQWDLTTDLPVPNLPEGWELRSVSGEHEANSRRAAAHAAFESTMDPVVHLQRYLDFMRSPAYVPERDLVAVAPDGTIVSFMVWWADESSIAQIEPFGTHPDHHRRGVGRALLYHGLGMMKAAGMTMCRVCTDDDRAATHFYEGVGFTDVGRLHWWKPS